MLTLESGVVVQIRNGPRLRKVIEGVLTVGNAVNVGTAYGNAQGIKLDSLLKLADVKVCPPPWPCTLDFYHIEVLCICKSVVRGLVLSVVLTQSPLHLTLLAEVLHSSLTHMLCIAHASQHSLAVL